MKLQKSIGWHRFPRFPKNCNALCSSSLKLLASWFSGYVAASLRWTLAWRCFENCSRLECFEENVGVSGMQNIVDMEEIFYTREMVYCVSLRRLKIDWDCCEWGDRCGRERGIDLGKVGIIFAKEAIRWGTFWTVDELPIAPIVERCIWSRSDDWERNSAFAAAEISFRANVVASSRNSLSC